MSSSLSRLRDYFGDELLILVGRRMEPTALGLSLGPPVREILRVRSDHHSNPTHVRSSHRAAALSPHDLGLPDRGAAGGRSVRTEENRTGNTAADSPFQRDVIRGVLEGRRRSSHRTGLSHHPRPSAHRSLRRDFQLRRMVRHYVRRRCAHHGAVARHEPCRRALRPRPASPCSKNGSPITVPPRAPSVVSTSSRPASVWSRTSSSVRSA